MAWHVGEGVGEVEVDDGVVVIGVVIVLDVLVECIGAVRSADAKLVWIEGGLKFVFGVVDVGAGGNSAKGSANAEWTDGLVGLEFGSKCGSEDGV